MFGLVAIFAIENLQKATFETGVELFNDKEYAEALDKFLLLENEGIYNADLMVNIGNCYFRMEELGNALVYYKKALKLDPTNEKAKRNLRYGKSLTVDAQSPMENDFISRFIRTIFDSFSIKFLAVISIILFILIIAFINYLILKYRGREKTVQYFVLVILIVCFVFSFSLGIKKWYDFNNHFEGVLITESAIGFSGPGADFTRVFTIHEGNIFDIKESRDNWTLIQLNSGLGGWINNNNFQRVDFK